MSSSCVPTLFRLLSELRQRKVTELGLSEDDYDAEWEKFCLLCEMLSTIIINKFKCEHPGEEDKLKETFSSLTTNDDRVEFIINNKDAYHVVEYFVNQVLSEREVTLLPSSSKSLMKSKASREEGNTLFRMERYADAVKKYSEVCDSACL